MGQLEGKVALVTGGSAREIFECRIFPSGIALSPAASRCAANSREKSRTGNRVPSVRESKRSSSASGRPTARRSRKWNVRMALTIASSCGGSGKSRQRLSRHRMRPGWSTPRGATGRWTRCW